MRACVHVGAGAGAGAVVLVAVGGWLVDSDSFAPSFLRPFVCMTVSE